MALNPLVSVLWVVVACTGKGRDGDDGNSTTPVVTDADGDGYDAIEHGGRDCDDDDPSVYPGAEDSWYDGIDSDCGGDDDFDADGDGWGTDRGDCDDSDRTISPAELDWCDDGIDQDCDGTVDGPDCGWGTDVAAAVWHDPQQEFLGWALATGCDMDGDGVDEVLASAPGDGYEGVSGRVVTLSEGEDFDPAGGLEIVRAASQVGFGSSVDCQGDLDGDGYTDLVIAAFDDGPNYVGRTIVVLGPVSGGTYRAEDIEDVVLEGRDPEGAYVYPVGHRAELHDVTGDGHADFVFASSDFYAPWFDGDADARQSDGTGVLRGPFEFGDVVSSEDGDYVGLIGGVFGAFAVADLDGDGINDVLRNAADDADSPDRCGLIFSGAEIADAESGTVFEEGEGTLTTLDCVADIHHGGVWNVFAEDLDDDGHPDPFAVHLNGWTAFEGTADWSDRTEPAARLEADFCDLNGLRDADFVRDDDGLLTWAVALQGFPDCAARDAGFEGRVAVFQGWEWAQRDFSETWRWVGWDADDWGLDPLYMGTRPVALSQEHGTRLWFGDPTWLTVTGGETNFGKVAAFQVDDW